MSNWQPIETAPKDGFKILGKYGEVESTIFWCASFQGWAFENESGVDLGWREPTLWQPLPGPLVRGSILPLPLHESEKS